MPSVRYDSPSTTPQLSYEGESTISFNEGLPWPTVEKPTAPAPIVAIKVNRLPWSWIAYQILTVWFKKKQALSQSRMWQLNQRQTATAKRLCKDPDQEEN